MVCLSECECGTKTFNGKKCLVCGDPKFIALRASNERLREVILLAPGSDEKGFMGKYGKWWDTYYREIRTPGCNALTIEQALKGK